MSEILKLCWFCKHFYFDSGSPAYSEYTPGEDATMSCFKGVYNYVTLASLESNADLAGLINTASKCPHFDPQPEVVEAAMVETERRTRRFK